LPPRSRPAPTTDQRFDAFEASARGAAYGELPCTPYLRTVEGRDFVADAVEGFIVAAYAR
jgi:hypothetical protein